MKLEFTRNLPKEEGYYWWTNFGEHTPTILEVKKGYSDPHGNTLWAQNEEFCFKIEKICLKKEDKDPELLNEDGYYHGEELWCRIPDPYLPGGKKQVKSNCY